MGHIIEGVLDLILAKRSGHPVGPLVLLLAAGKELGRIGEVAFDEGSEAPGKGEGEGMDAQVRDVLDLHAVSLAHQGRVAATVEHDLLDSRILKEAADGLHRDREGIDEEEALPVVELDEAEVLAVDMKVELPLEVHGHRIDLRLLPLSNE